MYEEKLTIHSILLAFRFCNKYRDQDDDQHNAVFNSTKGHSNREPAILPMNKNDACDQNNDLANAEQLYKIAEDHGDTANKLKHGNGPCEIITRRKSLTGQKLSKPRKTICIDPGSCMEKENKADCDTKQGNGKSWF